MSEKKKNEQFIFTYEGVQYDFSQYAQRHPGGLVFFQNMKTEKSEITQYFKALHSQKAEKILKSCPFLQQHQKTQSSIQFTQLRKLVQYLYKPNWLIQFILILGMFILFLIASNTDNYIIAFLCFLMPNLTGAWMAHSMNHSRSETLYILGRVFGGVVRGYASKWWNPKHNMHHMFTNSLRYDDDIKHNYKLYLYPFIFIKWRYDSFVTALNQSQFQLSLIIIHYIIVLHQNMCVGFFAALVLIGNHENQTKFPQKINMNFIDHQIAASKNYPYKTWVWLLLMGGMQFQTEHHFFPQIPFYNLPQASRLIENFLGQRGKKIKWGNILN